MALPETPSTEQGLSRRTHGFHPHDLISLRLSQMIPIGALMMVEWHDLCLLEDVMFESVDWLQSKDVIDDTRGIAR